MNERLIKALKEGRLKKGLKQSEVASIIGVKGGTLSNYENGISEPDIDTFAALCEIYELDFSNVLGEAYGFNVVGTDFDIRPSEIKHIKKYRALDPHGKDIVDTVLSKEHDRCKAKEKASIIELAQPALNAAHSRTDIPESEKTAELQQQEEDIMDDPDF